MKKLLLQWLVLPLVLFSPLFIMPAAIVSLPVALYFNPVYSSLCTHDDLCLAVIGIIIMMISGVVLAFVGTLVLIKDIYNPPRKDMVKVGVVLGLYFATTIALYMLTDLFKPMEKLLR